MSKEKYKDIKINTPVSLLVYGGNLLGYELAKTLMEQGGRIIIVDNYNAQTKRYVTELKKLGQADFVDFKGLEALYKRLSRIDYLFYLLSNKLLVDQSFNSKDFLDESNNLNITLKAAQKYNTKVSLVTSIALNQQLSAHILDANISSPSPYSPIELQKYCETLSAEYRDKTHLNIRIIRMGTILGSEMQEISDPILQEMLTDSANKGTISIKGEGLELHYLINIKDSVYGILKLTFASKTEGEVISLANSRDYTTLSIAYKLLEINPEIQQIRFVAADKKHGINLENYIPAPNAENYGWEQSVTLEQSIIDTIQTLYPKTGQLLSKQGKGKESEQITKPERTVNVKTPLGKFLDSVFKPFTLLFRRGGNSFEKFRNDMSPAKVLKIFSILIAFALAFYFFISPIINTTLGGYLAYVNAKTAYASVQSFNFTKAKTSLEKVDTYLGRIGESYSRFRWVFSVLQKDELFENSSQLIYGASYAVEGAVDLVDGVAPLEEYIKNFEPAIDFQTSLPTNSREYRENLLALQKNQSKIEKGAYGIEQAYTLIERVDLSVFPEFLQDKLVTLKELNQTFYETITPLNKVLTFAPDLLGVNERMRYLILLQNPGELRSTGGWISSYAILGIEGGQIRELKVDDVYNLDGQLKLLKDSPTPPVEMSAALDISTWGLALSNWYPDLSDVAETAENLIAKTDPGIQFDGVITIDTELLKSFLDLWEGVQIPGEAELITSANLDSKIFEIHKGFTPGSNVKSTFLANLSNIVLQRVLSSDVSGLGEVGNVIVNSMNEKHILTYFKIEEAYEYFDQKGWSGVITDKYKSAPLPIEWSWGGNKANLFIERSHNLSIDLISNEEIQYTYSLAIQNDSTSKIYPQGDYTNYLRVFVPENAKINSIKGFTQNTYDIYEENGFKIVGGFFNIATQSTKIFEVKYTLTMKEGYYNPIKEVGNAVEYNLVLFKQPGTNKDPIRVTVTYPESWATTGHEGFERLINQLTLQTDLRTDRNYKITWQYK